MGVFMRTWDGRPLPPRISAAWLKRIGACRPALIRFEEVFPDGADWTVEDATRALEFNLDVIRLLEWVYIGPLPERESYIAAVDQARGVFRDALRGDRSAFRMLDRAWRARNRSIASARMNYIRAAIRAIRGHVAA